MEKREHQRVIAGNFMVDISDGSGFFSGTVSDLSRSGLKLGGIAPKLNDRSKHLSVVISAQGKHFKMMARPRWSQTHQVSKNIGVEIVKAPFGWTEFVMDFKSQDNDTMGEIFM